MYILKLNQVDNMETMFSGHLGWRQLGLSHGTQGLFPQVLLQIIQAVICFTFRILQKQNHQQKKYLYACINQNTIHCSYHNLELKKDDWPFLNLHLPPWAGLPVHLQLQQLQQLLHSSLSYASCASYVSYLFYVSFPSSFSSSFHCHQHLKSGITNLWLAESQSKREQPTKTLLCSFNFSLCPLCSNLAWGSTRWTTVGLFGWWWRRTSWVRWWQWSGCSSWTFVSCRWRRNRSRGSSSHGLRTWTLSAKGQTWNSWAIQLQSAKYLH